MIDYSTLDNTAGAFPNITALNSTGPGATDGTPINKTVVDDLWGARQAIMDAAGLTPNGATEAAGASQMLTAINALIDLKIAAFNASTHWIEESILFSNVWEQPEWVRYTADNLHFRSTANGAVMAIMLDTAMVTAIERISIHCKPGAIRTGTNRMQAALFYIDRLTCGESELPVQIGSIFYDNGTTDQQTITLTASPYLHTLPDPSPTESRMYFVMLYAGNTAAAYPDHVNMLNWIPVKKQLALL